MNVSLLNEQVHSIVSKVLEMSETNELDNMEDLSFYGLDSIKAMELVVELECAFSIEFEDEELLFENFTTISEIMKRVSKKLIAT